MIIKNHIVKHASFVIIIIGAFALFLTNILLKKVLSPSDYGEYSIYITYFQLLSSFGLLGFEQVFLRISEVKREGYIQTDKTLFTLLVWVWVLFSLVGSFVFKTYFSEIALSYFYFLIGTLSVTFSMFVYNAFRLNSQFVASQLMYNLWKMALFMLGMIFLLKGVNSIDLFIEIFTYLLAFVLLIQLVFTLKKMKFDFSITEKVKTLNLYAFHFFVSLLTLTLIGYADRFIIKGIFGAEALGEYFFLATIFFFPFTLIQGYVGFKELVAFKEQASIAALHSKLVRITAGGVVLGVIIYLTALLINNFETLPYIPVKENLVLVVIFILTGIVKLNYSLFSALLGAKGDVKTIKNANIQSFVFILIIGALSYSFYENVEVVGLAFLLFWVSRTLIWQRNLLKQFKTNLS